MSDIVVTVNPSQNGPTISIGGGVYPHAATHAPSGSDSLSGYYYPANNPSGYVSSGDFATTGYVADVSGAIVAQISFPANVVFTTGDQNISGTKNFYSRPTVNGTGVLLSGEASSQSTGYLTGYVSKFESGVFYPINNPSGYITGVDLSNYSTIPYVTGISGYLQDQISAINISALEAATGNLDGRVSSLESQTGNYVSGNVIRPSDTGIFYTIDNPSGYITGVDLSNYVTGVVVRPSETGSFATTDLLSSYSTIASTTGISGYLQSEIDTIDLSPLQTATGNLDARVSSIEGQTGNFALKTETGAFLTTGAADLRFYPLSSNPSSYLVAADISSLASTGYVTGASGYLQGEIDTLQVATGLLYPRNNPSGYITGVDLSSYALQSSVTTINAQSGQWITGYNKSITGLSFAGTDTKTLTLYSRDGATLSANFTDLQGTGASINNIVYLTGDQNISGVKNFYSRPTVNGTGVLLSGEASSGGSISVEDSNLIIGLSIFL